MNRHGARFYWEGLSIIVVKTINNWGQGFIVGYFQDLGAGLFANKSNLFSMIISTDPEVGKGCPTVPILHFFLILFKRAWGGDSN